MKETEFESVENRWNNKQLKQSFTRESKEIIPTLTWPHIS